jgi:hypothetical protein
LRMRSAAALRCAAVHPRIPGFPGVGVACCRAALPIPRSLVSGNALRIASISCWSSAMRVAAPARASFRSSDRVSEYANARLQNVTSFYIGRATGRPAG